MIKGNEPKIIIVGLEAIGVDLSSDFTAEHEWGIQPIEMALGIPLDNTIEENFGIKGRTVTIFNEGMFFFEQKETHTCLLFDDSGYAKNWKWRMDYELNPEPKEMSAAWSERDFGIVMVNSFAHNILADLYGAFQKKDVAIMLGGSQGFQNPGLMIMIASKVPKEVDEKLRKGDGSYFRLQKAVEKTNIRQILKDAGKEYFALSPSWKGEGEKEITYWLNPEHQQDNNYGWFALQDLLDWAQDKGPIPMKKK